MIEAADNLNKQLQNAIAEKDRMKAEFEKERREMTRQIESVESENKRLLDTLIRHSKGLEVPLSPGDKGKTPKSGGSFTKMQQRGKFASKRLITLDANS